MIFLAARLVHQKSYKCKMYKILFMEILPSVPSSSSSNKLFAQSITHHNIKWTSLKTALNKHWRTFKTSRWQVRSSDLLLNVFLYIFLCHHNNKIVLFLHVFTYTKHNTHLWSIISRYHRSFSFLVYYVCTLYKMIGRKIRQQLQLSCPSLCILGILSLFCVCISRSNPLSHSQLS